MIKRRLLSPSHQRKNSQKAQKIKICLPNSPKSRRKPPRSQPLRYYLAKNSQKIHNSQKNYSKPESNSPIHRTSSHPLLLNLKLKTPTYQLKMPNLPKANSLSRDHPKRINKMLKSKIKKGNRRVTLAKEKEKEAAFCLASPSQRGQNRLNSIVRGNTLRCWKKRWLVISHPNPSKTSSSMTKEMWKKLNSIRLSRNPRKIPSISNHWPSYRDWNSRPSAKCRI